MAIVIAADVASPADEDIGEDAQEAADDDLVESRRLRKGFLIATSKELFDRGIKLLMARDEEGLRELMSTDLVGVTKEGAQVYVVRFHPYSRMAEIRTKDKQDTFWVSIEALK